jgi:hypothetical protein
MRDAQHMEREIANNIALAARAEFAEAEGHAARRTAGKLARQCYAARMEVEQLRAVLDEIARRASRARGRSSDSFAQIVFGDIAARACHPVDPGKPLP